MQTYTDFVAGHSPLDRARFLEQVQVPHLFFHDLNGLLETEEFQTLRSRQADTPVALPNQAALPAQLGQAGVCPVQKRAGSIGTRVSIGRSVACDITLTDARLSKSHAFFAWADGRWTLTDMGSTNGTAVDDLDLPHHEAFPLRSGARIRLAGLVEFVFLEPEWLFELVVDATSLLQREG